MPTLEEQVSVVKVENEFQRAYSFEVYDILGTILLFRAYRPVLYVICALYLTGIYFGQKWMKNRPAYDLKYTLFFWNLGLAVFSMISTIRAYPQALWLLSQPNGIYKVTCTLDVFNYATAFWALMFAISKMAELGDTAFIILRKQKLIFLHWFHHLSMVYLSWLGYEKVDTIAHLYVLNTFVHSFMYTYYALRALKIRIPKRIAMAMTTLQISQFLAGFYLGIPAVYWMLSGQRCDRDITFSLAIFVTGAVYLALFINFFVRSYTNLLGTKQEEVTFYHYLALFMNIFERSTNLLGKKQKGL